MSMTNGTMHSFRDAYGKNDVNMKGREVHMASQKMAAPQIAFQQEIKASFPGMQSIDNAQQSVATQEMDIQKAKMIGPNVGAGGNPFELEQYKNINFQDAPVKYGGGMVDAMISNEGVPDEVINEFWYVFNRDNVLTFLDEDRKNMKLLNFDIVRIDYLNAIPYYDYDFKMELKWNVIRGVLDTKLDRSLGMKGSERKNERTTLQSQFTENRMINDGTTMGNQGGGFFHKLFGRK